MLLIIIAHSDPVVRCTVSDAEVPKGWFKQNCGILSYYYYEVMMVYLCGFCCMEEGARFRKNAKEVNPSTHYLFKKMFSVTMLHLQ